MKRPRRSFRRRRGRCLRGKMRRDDFERDALQQGRVCSEVTLGRGALHQLFERDRVGQSRGLFRESCRALRGRGARRAGGPGRHERLHDVAVQSPNFERRLMPELVHGCEGRPEIRLDLACDVVDGGGPPGTRFAGVVRGDLRGLVLNDPAQLTQVRRDGDKLFLWEIRSIARKGGARHRVERCPTEQQNVRFVSDEGVHRRMPGDTEHAEIVSMGVRKLSPGAHGRRDGDVEGVGELDDGVGVARSLRALAQDEDGLTGKPQKIQCASQQHRFERWRREPFPDTCPESIAEIRYIHRVRGAWEQKNGRARAPFEGGDHGVFEGAPKQLRLVDALGELTHSREHLNGVDGATDA